jgi:hypothetical protein
MSRFHAIGHRPSGRSYGGRHSGDGVARPVVPPCPGRLFPRARISLDTRIVAWFLGGISVVKHPFLQPSSQRDACSFTIGLGRVEG